MNDMRQEITPVDLIGIVKHEVHFEFGRNYTQAVPYVALLNRTVGSAFSCTALHTYYRGKVHSCIFDRVIVVKLIHYSLNVKGCFKQEYLAFFIPNYRIIGNKLIVGKPSFRLPIAVRILEKVVHIKLCFACNCILLKVKAESFNCITCCTAIRETNVDIEHILVDNVVSILELHCHIELLTVKAHISLSPFGVGKAVFICIALVKEAPRSTSVKNEIKRVIVFILADNTIHHRNLA